MRILLFIILFLHITYGQIFVRGSMGLNFVNMSGVRDYINQNYAQGNDQLSSFNSAVEFGLEAGWHLKEYDVAIEGVYEFSNFSYALGFSQYNFDYTIYKPTLVVYKRIDGNGYFFRYGAGIGPRFTIVEETKPPVNTKTEYTSTGFGVVLIASGNTKLAENTYIYISGDLRYDFNGEPETSNGAKILYDAQSSTLNMKSLSAGIKLGLTYNF